MRKSWMRELLNTMSAGHVDHLRAHITDDLHPTLREYREAAIAYMDAAHALGTATETEQIIALLRLGDVQQRWVLATAASWQLEEDLIVLLRKWVPRDAMVNRDEPSA